MFVIRCHLQCKSYLNIAILSFISYIVLRKYRLQNIYKISKILFNCFCNGQKCLIVEFDQQCRPNIEICNQIINIIETCVRACVDIQCMQDTFARARTRPKGRYRPSARATIGYLVYNDIRCIPLFARVISGIQRISKLARVDIVNN